MSERNLPTARLIVDPIACDGIGLCAHLAGRLIRPDSWGFPIIEPNQIEAADLAAARTAVRACPRDALTLLVHPQTERHRSPPPS